MLDVNTEPSHGLPILYSFRRCPYAMRARLVVAACGLRMEVREVALRDKPAHLLALSSKGTVPVLWLPSGQVIDQSLEIMRWALEQHVPEDWLVLSDAQCAQGDAWVALLDGEFKLNLDRYKYPNRYQDCDPLPHRVACVEVLLRWEAQLSQQGSACLFGESFSLYDCAILPFVRQFRLADQAWFDAQMSFPGLQAWLKRFLASPLFERSMPRLTPWKPGNEPVFFP